MNVNILSKQALEYVPCQQWTKIVIENSYSMKTGFGFPFKLIAKQIITFIYFQIPSCLKNPTKKLIILLRQNLKTSPNIFDSHNEVIN